MSEDVSRKLHGFITLAMSGFGYGGHACRQEVDAGDYRYWNAKAMTAACARIEKTSSQHVTKTDSVAVVPHGNSSP